MKRTKEETKRDAAPLMYQVLREASTTIDVALDMLDFSDRPATKQMLVNTLCKVDFALDHADGGVVYQVIGEVVE